jgi:aspartyl-tRNA(Asn)/glutamyl-tRNA(Gln) amidotransferase subunit B
LELLVNNAGFGTTGPFAELDRDAEEEEVRLNVVALLRLTHAAVSVFQARGHGSVINVSSLAGFQPVTEPDLRSASDTRAFLGALKQILEYVEVSDCNMEEGSLRVDANVSVRPRGQQELGAKTEIKNVNSFSGVEKAVEREIARQIEVLESGGRVAQETLLWDDHRGRLRSMRSKEDSHDYRYFPDPDLPALVLEQNAVEAARALLPELPRARRDRFVSAYGLSVYEAGVLTQARATAEYFEEVVEAVGDPKAVANWVMGPAQALMNERREDAATFSVSAAALGQVIRLVADGTVSDTAAKKVLAIVAEQGGDPAGIVEAQGLTQVRDEGQLADWVAAVVQEFEDEVGRYRGGESRLLGFLVGQVMRRSGGKADPRRVNDLLREALG